MKKILFVSSLALSTLTMAADVDYSKCQQALGNGSVVINSDGTLGAMPGFQDSPDIKSVLNKDGTLSTTYTFKSDYKDTKGKPYELQYTLTKDATGNLIIASNVLDKMNNDVIKMNRDMNLRFAASTGMNYRGAKFDPILKVGDQVKPLSKLTADEAKSLHLDMSVVRDARKDIRRDKKAVAKVMDGYARFYDSAPVAIPNGQVIETEVVDGVCQVKKITSMSYDPKSKENVKSGELNRERCQEVIKVGKKYEKQMTSCYQTSSKLQGELYGNSPLGGGFVSGAAGGDYSSAMGSQSAINLGLPLVGYGYPGVGMGGLADIFGSAEIEMCKYYFEEKKVASGGTTESGSSKQ